jgi:hypothetical protein
MTGITPTLAGIGDVAARARGTIPAATASVSRCRRLRDGGTSGSSQGIWVAVARSEKLIGRMRGTIAAAQSIMSNAYSQLTLVD